MNAATPETAGLLKELGIERVIWIDDCFEDNLDTFKSKILKDPDLLKGLNLGWSKDVLRAVDDGEEGEVEDLIVQGLNKASGDELARVNDHIRKKAAYAEGQESNIPSPDHDLSMEAIMAACQVLNVRKDDRAGFEAGRRLVSELSSKEAQGVAFMVDLQDPFSNLGIGAGAGVDIIQAIRTKGHPSMVFILTHEASLGAEAQKEASIAHDLGHSHEQYPIPCVISKERLLVDTEDARVEGLHIALKRSALRHETFRVATKAEDRAAVAVKKTRARMGRITPEVLDAFFLERAFSEGVSDLHMVERIITAQVSKELRRMFGDDEEVKTALRRLRTLREIVLPTTKNDESGEVERFRQDEIWDDGEFLQSSYAPLALGDVFQTTGGTSREFILLGQSCDLTLRGNGSRNAETADLIVVKATHQPSSQGPKTLILPIGADQQKLLFDFRQSTAVNLDLLELATFNPNGEVSVSLGNQEVKHLHAGQKRKLEKARKLLEKVSASVEGNNKKMGRSDSRVEMLSCALTFSSKSPFNGICQPLFKKEGEATSLRWGIKRTRRLRSPHIDRVVDQQMAILNRRALDIDYAPRTEQ